MKYPLVVVEWDDASTDLHSHNETAKGKRYGSCLTYTAGWLVSEGDEGVVLFTDYVPHLKEFRCKHCIPNGMVKKIVRY